MNAFLRAVLDRCVLASGGAISPFQAGFCVAALLSVYLVFTLDTASRKSAYFDETAHLVSGYHCLKFGDYRVNTSNMILGQKLAALPLVMGATHPPTEAIRRQVLEAGFMDSFHLGRVFLYESGNDPGVMLFRGRVMMALLGVLVGLGVFFWARRLFGTVGGLVSLGFFCVCPTFISLGGIIGADMPAACFSFLAVWSFWVLLHRITPFTVGAFGVSAGLLLLSKMSGLVFGPVALLLLAIRLAWGKPMQCGFGFKADRVLTRRGPQAIALACGVMASAVIVVAVIWAGYGFRFAAAPANAPGVGLLWGTYEPLQGMLMDCVRLARQGHWLPEAFLFDLATLAALTGARWSFLLGETGVNGWLLYFPFTFLAKSNPAMIAGLCAVAGGWFWQRRRVRAGDTAPVWWKLYDCLPVLVFPAVFGSIACLGSINIGHRHILPLYPFCFVLLGGLAVVFTLRSSWPKWALGFLLATGVVNAVVTHPDPLAYISPLCGGSSQGYKMLVDSSLDWGQELPAVKQWLDAHPADRDSVPYFSYFGSGVPEAYGIRTRRLYGFFDWGGLYDEPLAGGTYLVSASMIQPVYYRRVSSLAGGGLAVIGPWCQLYENWYQGHLQLARAYFEARRASRAANDPALLDRWAEKNAATIGPVYGITPDTIESAVKAGQAKALWGEVLNLYDLLRLARLTHTLRQREPSDVIAHSVLVFRLSDEDVRFALDYPLPELPPGPIIKGVVQ